MSPGACFVVESSSPLHLSPALRELAAAMADWWVLPSAAVWRRGEVK